MSCNTQVSLTLEEVSKLFSNWRETRSARGRIPDALWKAVARLDSLQSMSKIAKALRLNCSQLKRKLQEFRATQDQMVALANPAIQKQGAYSHHNIQVTKIVSVESISANVPSSVEIVSPGGWVLRSTGAIKEIQILEFARAVLEVTV